MDSTYAREYRRLYERHWWWRARERAILAELRRRGRLTAGQRFLDIGCGDGLLFDRLSPYGDVEGVEVDASLVSEDGPWRDRIHVRPFDEQFRSDDKHGGYSVILMLDVLEHLPEPVAAMRHALDLLAPQGLFLLTVPAFRSLWTTHDDLNHHYTRYTQATFRQVAEAAGGRMLESRYLFQWTCPVKLTVRLKEAVIPTHPRPPHVPVAPINAMCYAMTRLEQSLFDRLSPPFGSSLLAVVERAG